MSDNDADDLLGLLEEDDEPIQQTSKRAASPAADAPAKKRRKGRAGSGSDMDMSDESEDEASSPPARRAAPRQRQVDFDSDDDDEDAAGEVTPSVLYPFRQIYKNREEYEELKQMNELEREAIIGARQEEIQAFKDRENLRNLVKTRDATGRGERAKKQTGKTDAKASALEKLKKTRKSKAARAADADSDGDYGGRRTRSKARDYSDEDASSEDDAPKSRRKKEVREIERAGRPQLEDLTLPRWRFAQTWAMPWFEDFIKGAWVRVSLGPDENRQLRYNWCEVVKVAEERAKQPYMLETHPTDVMILVKMGNEERLYTADQFSNGTPENGEYTRLQNKLDADELHLPSLRDYESKKTSIDKYKNMIVTEEDVLHQVKQKNELKKRHGLGLRKLELSLAREDAKSKNEHELKARLDVELAAVSKQIAEARIAEQQASANGSSPVKMPKAQVDAPRDALSAVNERNRQANRQAVRRAELAGRSQAKMGSEAAVLDPSARVKTTVRLLHDVSAGASQNASRAVSPAPGSEGAPSPVKANGAGTGAGSGLRLEQAIASKVTVDLGDF